MTKMKCDAPDEDDVWDDGPIPHPRRWKAYDRLTPAPPQGWLIMLRLGAKPQGLDIGCWLCALWEIADQERADHIGKLHMIARDLAGGRVLLVDPLLRVLATGIVADFNSRITGCDCSGGDCLAGAQQYNAMLVRARRAWAWLPLAERIARVQESNEDNISLGMALDGENPEFLRRQADEHHGGPGMGFLEEITGAR